MDEETKRALTIRLNWILGYLQENREVKKIEKEVLELLKDVRNDCIVPF
ncbi:hypothetical protein ACOAKC_01265 [Hathewaya histolytica]